MCKELIIGTRYPYTYSGEYPSFQDRTWWSHQKGRDSRMHWWKEESSRVMCSNIGEPFHADSQRAWLLSACVMTRDGCLVPSIDGEWRPCDSDTVFTAFWRTPDHQECMQDAFCEVSVYVFREGFPQKSKESRFITYGEDKKWYDFSAWQWAAAIEKALHQMCNRHLPEVSITLAKEHFLLNPVKPWVKDDAEMEENYAIGICPKCR